MDDQGDPLVHIQGFEQGIEVAAVLDEAIRARATLRQFVGGAHADQGGGGGAASWLQVGENRSPEGRRGLISRPPHQWGPPAPPSTYAMSWPKPCRRCF